MASEAIVQIEEARAQAVDVWREAGADRKRMMSVVADDSMHSSTNVRVLTAPGTSSADPVLYTYNCSLRCADHTPMRAKFMSLKLRLFIPLN